MKDQELKKDHILPGHMVSADHYISRAPGRIYQTKGKSDQSDMFSGECVFIDHASGYVSIKHQWIEPTWSPLYIMIFGHHLSWHKMILLELLHIHKIVIYFIYFIE